MCELAVVVLALPFRVVLTNGSLRQVWRCLELIRRVCELAVGVTAASPLEHRTHFRLLELIYNKLIQLNIEALCVQTVCHHSQNPASGGVRQT